jgi:hypothetical protein
VVEAVRNGKRRQRRGRRSLAVLRAAIRRSVNAGKVDPGLAVRLLARASRAGEEL